MKKPNERRKRRKPNHRARARRALPILQRLALRCATTSYKALCDKLGLHHRAAQWFLGEIQSWCRKHGLPPLQALVVNAKTGRPGSGYSATPCGGRAYECALREVWAHDWRSAPSL